MTAHSTSQAGVRLYAYPFACSLAAHIALREGGVPFTLVRVLSLDTKELEDGRRLQEISPKGQVPALLTPGGALITEMPAVLRWIERSAVGAGLGAAVGNREIDEVNSWLGYLNSELHKAVLWSIMSAATPEPVKAFGRELGAAKLSYLDAQLRSREFLATDRFTIVDAYLLWGLILAPIAGLDLEPWSGLRDYLRRLRARPAVVETIAAERLMLTPRGPA